MKIALLGFGKMGKIIERIALSRGHEIVLRKSGSDSFDGLQQADVAIDFSIPEAALTNITHCLNANIPIVSGTTGWLENYEKAANLCRQTNGAFIYGSNFSLGVNLFFKLNSELAKLMARFPEYSAAIEEIHHTQKRDAPSGTAITLAEGLIEESRFQSWKLSGENEANTNTSELEICAKRIENVPGTHTVKYDSPVDAIEITHIAHNREGFATGAVIAAEWLIGKKGVFTMQDVLEL